MKQPGDDGARPLEAGLIQHQAVILLAAVPLGDGTLDFPGDPGWRRNGIRRGAVRPLDFARGIAVVHLVVPGPILEGPRLGLQVVAVPPVDSVAGGAVVDVFIPGHAADNAVRGDAKGVILLHAVVVIVIKPQCGAGQALEAERRQGELDQRAITHAAVVLDAEIRAAAVVVRLVALVQLGIGRTGVAINSRLQFHRCRGQGSRHSQDQECAGEAGAECPGAAGPAGGGGEFCFHGRFGFRLFMDGGVGGRIFGFALAASEQGAPLL